MQLEIRAQNIILTDASDARVARRYIEAKKSSIAGPVSSLWKMQRGLVTIETAKHALEIGSLPDDWSDPWNEMLAEFVRDNLVPEWVGALSVAGNGIAKRVNRIQRKQFDFGTTTQSARNWIDSNGGTLIANLSTAQFKAVNMVLQEQIAQGMTSPYLLAQRIKPIVGLTVKEAAYVSKVLASLIEEGVPAKVVNSQVERVANTLHKNRAFRIARTELSDAYNFGQMDSLKQARDSGWLPGDPQKSWMAGGGNPCDVCLENEGAGAIPLDDIFPSGDERPSAHPNCVCCCSFEIRR